MSIVNLSKRFIARLASRKKWAGGIMAMTTAIVIVFYFLAGSVFAAPGTSSSSGATGTSYQKKVVQSSNGTIVAFFNAGTQSPTGISYSKSTDNAATWSAATQVDSINTADFSVAIDSSDNIYVAFQNSGGTSSIVSRKLTYSAGSWAVGSAVTVATGQSNNPNCNVDSYYEEPTIAVNSSGTLVTTWASCLHGNTYDSSRSTDSGTTWSSSYFGGFNNVNTAVTTITLAIGADMWLIDYPISGTNNVAIYKDIGTKGAWVSTGASLSNIDTTLRSATSTGSNQIDFFYRNSSNNHLEYSQYSISGNSFGSATTISSASSDVLGSITAGPSGQLTAFYQEFQATNSYKVAYKTFDGVSTWSSAFYVSGSTANNTSISSPVNLGSGSTTVTGVIWTTGTATPWTVNGSSVAVPTLTAPASGATGVSITPTFQLKTTDTTDTYAKYDISVYQSDCSTLVRDIDQTSSQTGWTGQDAQTSTAYVIGTTLTASTLASHTYQATALSNGTTYCWKARAVDPGGSGVFGSFSATRLFTTNFLPSAPTLTKPTASAIGVSTLPELRLFSTDQDNDYLQYWVDICSTSNCSSIVRSICQINTGSSVPGTCASPSQTGWTGQNQQSSTAYSAGQTAIHTYQPTALTANTQYWWRAYAIDPGGSNTWSSASSIGTFTTAAATRVQVNVGGGTTIYGGTTINP